MYYGEFEKPGVKESDRNRPIRVIGHDMIDYQVLKDRANKAGYYETKDCYPSFIKGIEIYQAQNVYCPLDIETDEPDEPCWD